MGRLLLLTILSLCPFSRADQKDYYYERYLDRLHSEETPAPESEEIQSLTFEQRTNPSNPKDNRVFSQRYYLNETYATDENSPVLFYLCGEAACTESVLWRAIHTHAKKLGAYLVALEHRYYGDSVPFDTLSTENLKLLTTENALADAAALQKFLMEERNYNGPWIVMGGSYPGSLAAYYRLKYPQLVVGALSSSGPVRAKENFEQYDRHVAQVAGPQCLSQIKKVVAIADAAVGNPEKMEKLKEKFVAQALKDDDDFIYLLADMAALAIQYGYRDKFCKLIQEEDPLEGYAQFTKDIYASWGIDAVSSSVQGAIDPNPKIYATGIGSRAWFYQSCTEYGYWQNAYHEPKSSARSSRINPAYHRKVCQRLFGIDKPVPEALTNRTFYEPLLRSTTSNILFTNGSQDPWMKLSIAKGNANDTNPNTAVYLIDQSAHCADLSVGFSSDSASLKGARARFLQLARRWIKR